MGRNSERIVTAAAGATIVYLSFHAFTNGVRRKIYERDKVCQVEGCNVNNKNHLEQHHIAPECLENGKRTETADPYSEPLLRYYEQLMDQIPPEKRTAMRNLVKKNINEPANGITICTDHHQELHTQGNFQEAVRLKQNPNHPGRPEELNQDELRRYIRRQILEHV